MLFHSMRWKPPWIACFICVWICRACSIPFQHNIKRPMQEDFSLFQSTMWKISLFQLLEGTHRQKNLVRTNISDRSWQMLNFCRYFTSIQVFDQIANHLIGSKGWCSWMLMTYRNFVHILEAFMFYIKFWVKLHRVDELGFMLKDKNGYFFFGNWCII